MLVNRCTGMKGKVRCCLTQGHSGWHHDGAWLEWLADQEREALYEIDPCKATVTYGEQTIACGLPANHRTAHRGEDLVWTDPSPIHSSQRRRGEWQ